MHFMRRRIVGTVSIGRRPAVAGVLFAFALVVAVVTALVLSALNNVTQNANLLDDQRSLETTAGALTTFRDQLGATLNDYAAWDDAAEFVYAPDRFDWIASNYGDMTINSELFDTALVIDSEERVLMAYHNGRPVKWTMGGFFGDGVSEMVAAVRAEQPGNVPEATGFVRTQEGIAAVGVALVRKKSGTLDKLAADRRYLVFARHLGADKIAKLAHTYVINGLALESAASPAEYFVDIRNPLGEVLGKLVWRSQKPGDVSFREVRSIVFTAVAIAGVFFLALLGIGSAAQKKLKSDEAAAREELLLDRLSGLRNRPGLFLALQCFVEQARHDDSYVKLIYLDLDGFKEVNDSFGHGAGDRLIKGVAAALALMVPTGAILARLGGDEFAIAVYGDDARIVGRELCDDLLELFSEPFMIGDRVAAIGCSIGTSVSKGGDIDGEELLRRADMAMYEAKGNGRGRYMAYEPHMDTRREEKNQLEADLKYAIENREITVVFQPVVNALSRRITGVEALARWNRAGYGPVSPDIFIAAAESSGLIDRLGLFVLRHACEAALQWPGIKLAVNISPVQFRNPAFAGHVQSVFEQTDMSPDRVRLEMTEGYFIHHPERASAAIDKLKQIGVSIALDDFGAGFASVGYLRRFGFNRMKIDRSLVVGLQEGGRSLDMLQATIALARSLDIPVTAEGVETEEQAAILHLCGCDELQGYLFSKPLTADEVSGMLEQQNDDVLARKVS